MAFESKPIGDYFRLQKGLGYLGKYLTDSKVGLIGLNSFVPGGGYKYGGEKSYSGPCKPEHVAVPGDLFIATTDITQDGRVLASPFLLPDNLEGFESVIFSGDIVKAVQIADGLLPEFLFNILRVKKFRLQAAYASTGTTVRRIPTDFVESMQVPVPSLQLQIAINACLSGIDQKIHENEQLSKTLEDIAQTIFKSWFIDFDPVKAKMAGGKPVGIDAATAALFPDSMEDSELGLIPKGWVWEQIGEVLDVVGGGTPSTSNDKFWNGDICWTTPKDLSSQQGLITTKSARMISQAGLSKISSGLIGGHSVLMSCRAPIGYISVNAVPTAVNQGFIVMRESKTYSPLYVVNWLTVNMEEIKNRAGGATFAEITRKAFRELPFLVPGSTIVEKFNAITAPILLKLENLTFESESLIALRDSLLPRLISGELQIPEEMLAS